MICVAIIGAGIGREHLEGYRALPDSFKVRTICDLNIERAAQLVSDDDDITLKDDFSTVLSDPDIDLVDICLPPHLHFSMTKQALIAGKDVICEKPLVRALAEADALAEVSKAAGKRIFPVFQYRYGAAARQLGALINAGLAGKPLVATLETHWNRQAAYYDVDWRGTWEGESGGAVLGHAIHNHDLLCHFMGSVETVSAMLDTRVNTIEVEDCAAIAMRMQSGALATSSITLGSSNEEISRLRFVFSELTVESDGTPYRPAVGPWRFEARNPDNQPCIDEIVTAISDVKCGFAGFFEAVADALHGKLGREITLADGRRSIELVTAIYQSARSGQSVSLPLREAASLYGGWMP